MPPAIWLVLLLSGSAWTDHSTSGQAPSYSATSIVNAASNQANAYAPNTFVSIYGANLAFATRALGSGDISGNTLPTLLPGTGVRVWVANVPAQMYYVSPTQINILLPTDLVAGPTQLRVEVDSTYGPAIDITLAAVAPAFFQLDGHTIIAAHANGQIVTEDAPAAPGEWIVLYATGLGNTIPEPGYGEIPAGAAMLADMSSFAILLNGAPVDPKRIAYAGVAPGFAGLYQINMQLPDGVGQDPEIRVSASSVTSPAGLKLPVGVAPAN
jgi:uncharacterized protein (TIGR03437 family)